MWWNSGKWPRPQYLWWLRNPATQLNLVGFKFAILAPGASIFSNRLWGHLKKWSHLQRRPWLGYGWIKPPRNYQHALPCSIATCHWLHHYYRNHSHALNDHFVLTYIHLSWPKLMEATFPLSQGEFLPMIQRHSSELHLHRHRRWRDGRWRRCLAPPKKRKPS